MICVFLAILALVTDGSARASSKELVWRDCVPPKTAAKASIVVLNISTEHKRSSSIKISNIAGRLSGNSCHSFVDLQSKKTVNKTDQKIRPFNEG